MSTAPLDFHREEDEWEFWQEKMSEEDMDTLEEKLDFLLNYPEKPNSSVFPNYPFDEDR